MISINTIKKELYKQKPEAIFVMAGNGLIAYNTIITHNGLSFPIIFNVPFEDMGEAVFRNKMESQLLIRWIVPYEK